MENFIAGLKFLPNARELAKRVRGLARKHGDAYVKRGFLDRSMLKHVPPVLENVVNFRDIELWIPDNENETYVEHTLVLEKDYAPVTQLVE